MIGDRSQLIEALKEGTLWKHRNGNVYTVVAISNLESTKPSYPPTVVYVGTNGKTWSRPVSTWAKSFELVGKKSRFVSGDNTPSFRNEATA